MDYIQYITSSGRIKTHDVVFVDVGFRTEFEVKGILEDFFILSVFQNNKKLTGIGFLNIVNNDMLGFINSDLVDVNLVPNFAFFSSESIVKLFFTNISYKQSLENFQKNYSPTKAFIFGDNQLVQLPIKHFVGVKILNDSDYMRTYFISSAGGYRQYQIQNYIQHMSAYPYVQVNFMGFTIYIPPIDNFPIDLIINLDDNTFDFTVSSTDITADNYILGSYLFQNGLHRVNFERQDSEFTQMTFYVGYNVPVGFNFVPF